MPDAILLLLAAFVQVTLLVGGIAYMTRREHSQAEARSPLPLLPANATA